MTELRVGSLTCEYRANLLGTDLKAPRLGWKIISERRGTVQQAYQIQVAGPNADFESLWWDSGRIDTEQSIQVAYAGPETHSCTRYHYRVKVWDGFDRESAWSEPTWWETGLLEAGEWKAQWITPDSNDLDPHAKEVFMLRNRFEAGKGIRSARIYATAAGVYELYMNGHRVGDELLAPGWTSYTTRHQYQTYDVTAQLQSGANGIGVLLGDGWYKGELTWLSKRNIYGDRRAALLQLHIQYEDGSQQWVVSDSSWKCSTGPILLSELYAGEIYDARLEKEGWSEADYPDADWKPVTLAELPLTQLVAQENWPCRVTETIHPVKVIRTPMGELVLDMGQNLVGRIRITVEAPAGTRIRLQHAEVLDREGNFYTANLRKAKATIEYVAKGEGTESYAPYFTFQGFRYVKVEGFPDVEDQCLFDSFTAEVIHSDMERSGHFECSDPMVNQLQRNIVWGQRGNFLDVPTDCPQRDERLGWTGDAQVFIRTAAFNYHVGPFFTKWLRDLKADQRQSGSVPFVIPNALEDYISSMWGDKTYTSSAWGDAATVCPWTVYLVYGDERLLAEQYSSMKAWVEFIRSQGESEHLWNTGFHFGDWLALDAHEGSYFGATPVDLVATSYYALSTRILRDTAKVLGKQEDAREYSNLLDGIIANFRETFLTSEGRMKAQTQTAQILPLVFGLVREEERRLIASDLNMLVIGSGYHLNTGFVGTPYLCLALSENGYHETAVKLLLQETYPSWLYAISKGATTIWEHWDGIKPDGSFWSDDMNSYNHYAYGAIGEWMYRYIAGLEMDETAAAYKRIRIQPHFEGALTSANASFESPYGKIESQWNITSGVAEVQVSIPVNTTAEITLPGANMNSVRESGIGLTAISGALPHKETVNGVCVSIGSGTYRFTYPY
ncbi:glycoside hydrolase family 78 protein [Paenibacillus whitsoniae]|uniref:alpha-L-rhamnosidase n=1 Tax=Paenibacillus whitsoniae TaxID=2496558 RepID=A0A3S0ASN5_9BACL|nr:glycoside hydrolase family 78 protein [Paenibacillus whitsoniae]RTE11682.1 alpha-L-rhamnosidase [Paenibacillus whitsoniae]